jgi:ribonuclease HI
MLRMYTDGACTNNGRASSRGAIGVAYPDFLENSFGEPLPSDAPQTNQTAELQAIYSGLERLKTLTPPSDRVVRVCTDSEYSINCLTKWVSGWKKKGCTGGKQRSYSHTACTPFSEVFFSCIFVPRRRGAIRRLRGLVAARGRGLRR